MYSILPCIVGKHQGVRTSYTDPKTSPKYILNICNDWYYKTIGFFFYIKYIMNSKITKYYCATFAKTILTHF